MHRKRIPSIVLAIVLALNVCAFTGCSEDTVKLVKQKVTDLQIYTDSGLQLVADFQAQGILKEDQARVATDALTQIKTAVAIFIDRAKGYTKIDASSKAELYKLFVDVVSGVRDFQAKAGPVIAAALKALGVGEADELMGKVSVIINVLVTAARIIESRLIN